LKNKILILGGTGFSGRILTEELLKTDFDLTLFNRGKRNPGIFPEVKRIVGDRETDDIKQISRSSWDTVIDFSGMQPANIELIMDMMKGKIGRYIFVSTASVFPLENSNLKFPINEEAEILPCSEEQKLTKDINAAYGNKKAECERILQANYWLDVIIFRPGLIYGRYDWSDRFYYWLYRSKTQNEILIPENGKSKATNTFSEDLAKIIQEAITIKNHSKVYNAVTHKNAVSIKEIIDIACGFLKTSPNLISAPVEFLRENNVTEWMDFPMWLHEIDLIMDNTRLTNDFKTPMCTFEESVDKSISYFDSLGWNEGKYGLRLERERELIKKLTGE
jgi:2'-hydroxyisoflavone reductase